MMKEYLGKDSDFDKLVEDMLFDRQNFPTNRTVKLEQEEEKIHEYLRNKGAWHWTMKDFNYAWAEYEKYINQ